MIGEAVVHQILELSSLKSDKAVLQLERKFFHHFKRAVSQYGLIQGGDRILVCVSGGKDSLTMALLFKKFQSQFRLPFEMLAFTLDQSQPGWNDTALRAFYEKHEIPYDIVTKDTYSVVKEKIPEHKTYCGLCSRLRRGNIYQYARTHGYNKIALGHHRDDLIETLVMSMMFNGQIRSMPPKLLTDSKEHIVIRPMCTIQESDLIKYSRLKKLPIIPCTLCGSQPNMMRSKVKKMLTEWSQLNPKIPSNMLRALSSVNPSHLMDTKLWDFKGLVQPKP